MNHQTPSEIRLKPWGKEIWFAAKAGYVGKVLEVKKGGRLSLQYHERKTETQYVLSGKVKLTIGNEPIIPNTPDTENLREIILNPGDKYDILPYTVHRIEGLEDSVIFEVSTAETDDIIRLADDYGRPKEGNHQELDRKLSEQK